MYEYHIYIPTVPQYGIEPQRLCDRALELEVILQRASQRHPPKTRPLLYAVRVLGKGSACQYCGYQVFEQHSTFFVTRYFWTMGVHHGSVTQLLNGWDHTRSARVQSHKANVLSQQSRRCVNTRRYDQCGRQRAVSNLASSGTE